MQWCSVDKYGSGTVEKTLRSGDTGHAAGEFKHGVVIKDGAQACPWRCHSYKQLTHGQLKKCTPGDWQSIFLGVMNRAKNNIWHI